MVDNPRRDEYENEPGMIPIYDAIRQVVEGGSSSITIPVDSHLITSHGHRVGLRIRLMMIAAELNTKMKIQTRLVVSKGRPPKGNLTISRSKQPSTR